MACVHPRQVRIGIMIGKNAVATSTLVRYTETMTRPRQNTRCHAGGFRDARKPSGFSLIELLIVLALLLVLTTMYWGFSARSYQVNQQKACRGQLQKIFIAMQIYANDSAGKFPVVTGAQTSEAPLDLLVPRYTVDTATFICPGSKDSALPAGESLLKHKISYAYYMGRGSSDTAEALMSDKQVDALAKTAGQTVFSSTGKPPGNNHHQYGGNFLFGDGRTEKTSPSLPFSLALTHGVVLLNPKP